MFLIAPFIALFCLLKYPIIVVLLLVGTVEVMVRWIVISCWVVAFCMSEGDWCWEFLDNYLAKMLAWKWAWNLTKMSKELAW